MGNPLCVFLPLPLEYKLLDYEPEPWSNLKIALFLKQMSKTLAGFDTDMKNTESKSAFSFEELMILDPHLLSSKITRAMVSMVPVIKGNNLISKKMGKDR